MSLSEWLITAIILSVLGAGFFLLRKAGGDKDRLALLKDRLAVLQSLSTIGALVIGGVWAYNAFVAGRVDKHRLDINQEIVSRRVTPDFHWVHVTVSIKNVGLRHIEALRGETRVQAVAPLLEGTAVLLGAGTDPIGQEPPYKNLKPLVMGWATLCYREQEMPLRIEPGETQTINYEFFVPAALRTIKVYSQMKSPQGEDDLVWARTAIYDIEPAGAGSTEGAQHAPEIARGFNYVCSAYEQQRIADGAGPR